MGMVWTSRRETHSPKLYLETTELNWTSRQNNKNQYDPEKYYASMKVIISFNTLSSNQDKSCSRRLKQHLYCKKNKK